MIVSPDHVYIFSGSHYDRPGTITKEHARRCLKLGKKITDPKVDAGIDHQRDWALSS